MKLLSANCHCIGLIELPNVSGGMCTFHRRHNERDGVWNHQRLDCLLNLVFRSKKTSKLRVTGLCEGNPPVQIGAGYGLVQTTNHYLSPCWPKCMSPKGFTRPQWINTLQTSQEVQSSKSDLEFTKDNPYFCHDHVYIHGWRLVLWRYLYKTPLLTPLTQFTNMD